MKTKNVSQIKLTDSQLKSVQEYCKLNNIEDVDNFITKCYIDGYNIQKYGLIGDDSEKIGGVEEKQVEIEVIKEIRVEVPVETIKEIEVIKYVDREVIKEVRVEVPVPNLDNICDKPESIIVEKIVEVIKEVPVEKIVEKIVEVEKPNDKVLLLQETLQALKKELSLKNSRIEELEEKNKLLESNKISQGAVYLKGSNLNEMM
jgi:hypothetical protein